MAGTTHTTDAQSGTEDYREAVGLLELALELQKPACRWPPPEADPPRWTGHAAVAQSGAHQGVVNQLASQVRKLSSGLGVEVGLTVCPGFVFVVAGSVASAAVQDSDQAVGQGAQRSVVQVPGIPTLVANLDDIFPRLA